MIYIKSNEYNITNNYNDKVKNAIIAVVYQQISLHWRSLNNVLYKIE